MVLSLAPPPPRHYLGNGAEGGVHREKDGTAFPPPLLFHGSPWGGKGKNILREPPLGPLLLKSGGKRE